jgi:uncharacterized glyoxalase superfamily protein PhnB
MKITKLLLLSIAVIFYSCGDDEDPKPTSEKMVGTWAITALDYKGSATSTNGGTTLTADLSGTGKNMNITTTFGANPNTVTSQGSYTIVMKTTFMGQTETAEENFYDIFLDGTWTLNGNTLSITDNNGTEKATIVEQTNTTLKLKLEVNETETFQGTTITTKTVANYTLTKK